MKTIRVGRLLVVVAIVSWTLAGTALAQTQLPSLNPDLTPVAEVVNQALPPLPDPLPSLPDPVPSLPDPVPSLPDPVPSLPDKAPPPVDKVLPPPGDAKEPSPVADLLDEVQPQSSPVADENEGPGQTVTTAPAKEQRSGGPSAVKTGGKSRPVAQAVSAEAAAAPDDLEEVATSGQQIAPGQVLGETLSATQVQGPDQGPGLSRTGFQLLDWIAAAGYLMAAGWLFVWASRRSPLLTPSRV